MPYEDVLRAKLGADSFTTSQFRDNRRVIVKSAHVFAVLKCLREECGFDMLFEMTEHDGPQCRSHPAAMGARSSAGRARDF